MWEGSETELGRSGERVGPEAGQSRDEYTITVQQREGLEPRTARGLNQPRTAGGGNTPPKISNSKQSRKTVNGVEDINRFDWHSKYFLVKVKLRSGQRLTFSKKNVSFFQKLSIF